MTALLLALSLAEAHTPQAGLVEVALDGDRAGTLRWRAPGSGPASALAPVLPDDCVAGPVRREGGEGYLESAATFRCEAPPGAVALGPVEAGAQVIASVRRSGSTSRVRLGAGDVVRLDLPTPPPTLPVGPVTGAGLVVAAAALLGRARWLAHALGVAGMVLVLRGWLG